MTDPSDDASKINNANDDSGKTVAPVSAPALKEQGPTNLDAKIGGIDVAQADQIAKKEGDEYWESYAREIELEKEIAEMGGVEKIESGEVAIPEDVAKEMGIASTTDIQTPMAKVTDFSVRGISLTDDQLSDGLTRPTSSGFKWIAEWFVFQLLKAHFHIKRIRNKVLRTN